MEEVVFGFGVFFVSFLNQGGVIGDREKYAASTDHSRVSPAIST